VIDLTTGKVFKAPGGEILRGAPLERDPCPEELLEGNCKIWEN